jgi:hypothetical protein
MMSNAHPLQNLRVMTPEDRVECRNLDTPHVAITTNVVMNSVVYILKATPAVTCVDQSIGAHGLVFSVRLKDIKNALSQVLALPIIWTDNSILVELI